MKTIAASLAFALVAALGVAGSGNVYAATATSQSAEQYRTSKLVGQKVYNDANDNIGSVEDIVLKPDGSLDTVVLSVGGFLGIGDKYVAVPFNSLKISRDGSSLKIVTSGTKESLKALPDYQFYKS